MKNSTLILKLSPTVRTVKIHYSQYDNAVYEIKTMKKVLHIGVDRRLLSLERKTE